MNRLLIVAPWRSLICLLGVIVGVSAAADSDEALPAEPDIVLPTVVREIEDLSAPEISTGLPEDEELLLPPRNLPLPDAGDFPVTIPDLGALDPTITGGGTAISGDRFALEANLGAGSASFITSSVSVVSLGIEPRFRLAFAHELLDSYGPDHPAGTGYHRRSDEAGGLLELAFGELSLRGEATYGSREFGLQGQSSFDERTVRDLAGVVNANLDLSDRFTTALDVRGSITELNLAAATPETITEVALAPTVRASLEHPVWNLGGSLGYDGRLVAGASGETVHRGFVGLEAGVELPWLIRIDGAVQAYASTTATTPLSVPFMIAVSGTPWALLSFRVEAGLRPIAHSNREVLRSLPFVAPPVTIVDGQAWYGTLGVQGSVTPRLSLLGGVDVAQTTSMIDPQAVVGGGTYAGLHGVTTTDALMVTPNVGVRWQIGSAISLLVDWRSEAVDHAGYAPVQEIDATVSIGNAAGGSLPIRADATVSFDQYEQADRATQLPEIDLEVAYRASDVVTIVANVRDLLWPLIGGPRMATDIFEEPGIRGSIGATIEL